MSSSDPEWEASSKAGQTEPLVPSQGSCLAEAVQTHHASGVAGCADATSFGSQTASGVAGCADATSFGSQTAPGAAGCAKATSFGSQNESRAAGCANATSSGSQHAVSDFVESQLSEEEADDEHVSTSTKRVWAAIEMYDLCDVYELDWTKLGSTNR